MQVFNTVADVRNQIKEWRKQGLTVGLVPTMGYLHEGHQSLMAQAKQQNDKVIVSVFVNPIQFGPNEDLANYPRDLDRDILACQNMGVDMIFCPPASEMYDPHFSSFVDVTGITEQLCGKRRPGHFKGVCTVVTKLFNITQPDRAYFGQKDAQQLAVIKQMVNDLNIPIVIVGCPIIREADGLAKSSRNSYLSTQERNAALCLYQAITLTKSLLQQGERQSDKLINAMKTVIEQQPLATIDYIKITDFNTLKSVKHIEQSVLIALAVFIGNTRLIDNFVFTLPE